LLPQCEGFGPVWNSGSTGHTVKVLKGNPDQSSARKRFRDPCSENTAAIAGVKGQKNIVPVWTTP